MGKTVAAGGMVAVDESRSGTNEHKLLGRRQAG
jgi:hypothetical protein